MMMVDDPSVLLPVSPAAQRAARTLIDMSMGTVAHLAHAQGVSIFTLYPAVRELEREGLVTSTAMGAARGGQAGSRWFTPLALETMGIHYDSWHLPGERGRLLERFPLVDRFYRAANSLTGLGRLQGVTWFSGLTLDAAAVYERGWSTLFWSGPLETERGLRRRLIRLGQDMIDYSITDDPAWPGVICWVVADRWQRELVLRATKHFRLQDQMAIWCVADDSYSAARNPQASRGGLYQPTDPRSLGTWTWDRRVEASLWRPAAGGRLEAVLRVVADWPGCRTSFVQAATHEGDRKRTGRLLRDLLARRWLRRETVRGVGRYSITSKGLDILARLDGTSSSTEAMERHLPAWERRGLSQSHEDRVMDLAARLMAAGVPVAAGWRSLEHMGVHGAIKPDAMVLLAHSPYGPGWHYLEYEQSARRAYKLSRKLRGYASDRRQDDWPVMVVVWDEEAERILQELGLERKIRMLTITRGRLAAHEAVGGVAIWSMYGRDVPIG